MNFEKIVKAAIENDPVELKKILEHASIDEWKPGNPFCSPAAQLAMDGNEPAVNFLIDQGASIECVIMAVIVTGNKEYFERLFNLYGDLVRYPLIQQLAKNSENTFVELMIQSSNHYYSALKYAAKGAAAAGNKDYVECLIQRDTANYFSFDSDVLGWAAQGAIISKNRDYADELILRAKHPRDCINDIAYYAAKIDDKEYVEKLIERTRDKAWMALAAIAGNNYFLRKLAGLQKDILTDSTISSAARGAVHGGHITSNLENQLEYLSFYKPKLIHELIGKVTEHDFNPRIVISGDTEKRSISIHNLRNNLNLNFPQALAITDPDCQGLIFLLALFVMKSLSRTLPCDIWQNIFNLVMPKSLNKMDLSILGFVVVRFYISTQLSAYQMLPESNHKDRASNFSEEVSSTTNIEGLKKLISNQAKILNGNNPYPFFERFQKHKRDIQNETVDRYHEIIHSWN